MASRVRDNAIEFNQGNTFYSSGLFNHTNLRYSKYFKNKFIGIGATAEHTYLSDQVNYTSLGLGIGYSNILFDKLYLKLGLTYKAMLANNPEGLFEYYGFQADEFKSEKTFSDNINWSVSISSGYQKYYLSFSMLNIPLPWSETEGQQFFPKYFVVNAGDLMTLFGKRKFRLNYTFFGKTHRNDDRFRFSHFINFRGEKPLTRKYSLLYGVRLGLYDDEVLQCIPELGVTSKKFLLQLSSNLGLYKEDFLFQYNAPIQLRFLYSFNRVAYW